MGLINLTIKISYPRIEKKLENKKVFKQIPHTLKIKLLLQSRSHEILLTQ